MHRLVSRSIIFFVALLFANSTIAQRISLAADVPFFKEKTAVFQRWLDSTGLGNALRVDEVRLKNNDNTELELYLLVRTQDPDTASGIWQRLRLEYDSISGNKLEELLFRTFVFKMEIPPEQGNIQIGLRDENDYLVSCFSVKIWGDDTKVRFTTTTDNCKAEKFDINIRNNYVHAADLGRKMETPKPLTPPQVFERLCQFFNAAYPAGKYAGTDCAGLRPFVECRRVTDTHFTIIISDLCREALPTRNTQWCDNLRRWSPSSNCNDMQRERIEFIFDYIPGAGGSYRLSVNMFGKFGSTPYQPRQKGWIDMDPDFKSFEQVFAYKTRTALQHYLNR